ncbi:hypothetical protein K6Y31_17600 [Motilimonas cestriensis]|uniref:Phage protein n=1 Tax=Motilimonas cestriensis TaxID=2742685 RepID=A0ABS8WG64_9GAMM|nr:hypothetical protein [Motilimonas cestriensis]MCE2596606.1 hypothetical protein [Motilimonas cestriensis]
MNNDMNKTIINALFTQQRLQVLSLGVHHDEFTDAYLYAWYNNVYPLFHDGDGSVPIKPHEHYQEQFLISIDKVDELSKYLDQCWQDNNVPTFYALEKKYGVTKGGSDWTRAALIHICRYMKLDDAFDDEFWAALLALGQYPSEAASINRKFDRKRNIDF